MTTTDDQFFDDVLSGSAGEIVHDLVMENGRLRQQVEELQAAASIERGLQDALAGRVHPVAELWDGIEADEGDEPMSRPTTINWRDIRASTFEPPSIRQWRFELQDGTVLHAVSMMDYDRARTQIRRASQDIIEAQAEVARLRDELNRRDSWQPATGKLPHGRYAVLDTFGLWSVMKYDGDWHLRPFGAEPVLCFLLPPNHEDEEE